MKKPFLLSFFFLFFSFFLFNSVEARSGCCSHHGGVCSCGCCDGTSLSATCAPYYPSCNNDTVEANTVTEENNVDNRVYKAATIVSSVKENSFNANQPVNIETNAININTKKEEALPSIEQPQKAINLQNGQAESRKVANIEQQIPASVNSIKTKNSDDGGFWVGLVFCGAIGYIIYLVKRKKNKKR